MADSRGGGEGASPAAADTRRSFPGHAMRFAHLAVLCALALAQPLFNLLGKNPEFFAARGSGAKDIIVLSILLVVVPPLALFVVELLVGLVSRPAADVLHVLFIAGIAAVFFVQALKKSIDSSDTVLIALALALGGAAAALYWRAEPVRAFLSVLSPAPLVFLVLFVFFSPVNKLVSSPEASAKNVSGGSNAPVVILGLDEFTSTDLWDSRGRIDAKRWPGFAQLASRSTWFKNTHTIYDSTTRAWPAIMDGNYPRKGSLPTSADHPNSIFALLGKRYVMNVSEEATNVCPRELCKEARLDQPFVDRLRSMGSDLRLVYEHVVAPPGIENNLPTVSESWGNFGGGAGGGEGAGGEGPGAGAGGPNTKANLEGARNKRLDAWIGSIKPTRRPSLNFKHVLLPHVPWQYLPDGRQYRRVATEPIPGISRQSYKDQGQVDVLQQRHLLQTGFADLEVQKLIRRLKRTGMWDRALVVVAADHGVSFRKGQFDRRNVNERNIDEISPVPFFLKRPGQKKGEVNTSVVETTDILPTILDVLKIKQPARTDGRSAYSAAVAKRSVVKMLRRDLSGWIRIPAPTFEARLARKNAQRIAKFGQGAFSSDRVYRIGPNQELLGRRTAALGVTRSTAKATLVDSGEYRNTDPAGTTVPIWVTGRVSGGRTGEDIAVAVNGVVRGVGSTFRLATGGGEIFGLLVPEDSFRKGRNRVEVFRVAAGRLERMGGSG